MARVKGAGEPGVDDSPPGDIPCYLIPGETLPRGTVRIRPLPRKIKDFSIKRLNLKQRTALQEFYERAKDPKNKGRHLGSVKREAAVAAGYSEENAGRTMKGLLERKTVVEELEKAGVTDARIAEVIAEGLESEHPMKPGRPDPHAIHKFVQEANKLRDNYPETKVSVRKETKKMVVHFTAGNVKQFNKYQEMRGLVEHNDRD